MYEEFFGLSDAPFRLTPDPRFLYLSPKHAEALAHLRLGLTEPGGFVCITGDIGTGKTTVLRTFLADLGPEVATAFIFNPTLSWDDLLHRIARELGVPVTGTSHVDVMDALNTHLLSARKAGRISVVVIDEAQAVPLEVLERLRLLSNLETSTEKLLRLVLVGQPQLARLLLDPALAQLNQRITLRWHLAPLTRQETFAYVRHRLAVAGGATATHLFTGRALARVHRFSGGVPRLVNMISHRAALAAYVRRQRRITPVSVRRAYREIRTVPLVQGSSWRLGWLGAAGALAVVAGLATIGVPRAPWSIEPPVRDEVSMPAAASPASPEPEAAVAAVPSPLLAVMPAAGSAPDATAATDQLEQRLARINPERRFRAALETILAGWHAEPLRGDEEPTADHLEGITHRRGLEDLRLTGNLSMLRLLDLPAVLELRLPGMKEPSFVALTAIDDGDVTLEIGHESVRVSPAALDRVWFGDAHVLWRDFEWLGPTFGGESKGPHVARLQGLLGRAGVYGGPTNGTFDGVTETAVLGFQRSRRLDADGRVGRLTRIALYGAVGGYPVPTLAKSPRARSADPATGGVARGDS